MPPEQAPASQAAVATDPAGGAVALEPGADAAPKGPPDTEVAPTADGAERARQARAARKRASKAANKTARRSADGTTSRADGPDAVPPPRPARRVKAAAPPGGTPGATTAGKAPAKAAATTAGKAPAKAAATTAATTAAKAPAKTASKRTPKLPGETPGPPASTEPTEQSEKPEKPEQPGKPEQRAELSLRDLLTAVERLRTHIATLPLAFEVGGVDAARQERESLIRQFDDYLLPRLRRPDAPVLAVIGGSTGAGKSTLTNSLVRREVSRSGVLRPTTRSPVLVHHPYDSGAFLSQRILPGLTRVTSEAPEPAQPIDPDAPRVTGLRLVPHDGLAPGLAIVDAPDIDSLVDTNRDLAVQLLSAADLWIFVTTAARYADAMPWEMLRQSVERGVAVAIVLDRIPPESLQDVRIHLATRLRDRGLGGAPVFTIPETELSDGLLPEQMVNPVISWLRRVAGDARAREIIVTRTLRGALTSLLPRVEQLASAADDQAAADGTLRRHAEKILTAATHRIDRQITDGSLVRAEVLARWHEFVANGELVRRLDPGSLSFTDRIITAIRGERQTTQPLLDAVRTSVTAALRAATTGAVDDVITGWRSHPYGAALLQARRSLLTEDHPTAALDHAVGAWYDAVRQKAAAAIAEATPAEPSATSTKKSTKKPKAAPDVDAATAVLLINAIDQPAERAAGDGVGDGVGAEATAAAARRVLGAVIGEDAVYAMSANAREDLRRRAAALLDAERARFERLLNLGTAAARGDALRVSAAVLRGRRSPDASAARRAGGAA